MNINILKFQQNRDLSLVQFSTEYKNTFEYISLSTAINNNYLEITEIDESGDVNNLIALNKSDYYIFIMDGDVLEGAKQNRVMNSSVLLAPKRKYFIPVSCVEQGRWRFVSKKFSNAKYSAPVGLRAKRTVKVSERLASHGKHAADQSEVWHSVEGYSHMFSVHSPTSSLSDVYEEKSDKFEQCISSFEKNNSANGLAVFVRKNLLCLDVFNRTDIYEEYFDKILRGVAFEAFMLKPGKDKLTEAEANYKTQDFFDVYETIEKNTYPGIGVGTEFRFESDEVTGVELKYNEHPIHLTALSLK